MRRVSTFARCTVAVLALTVAVAATAQTADPRVERVDPALDTLIAPTARVERVATGFTFTEGPLWHKGRLWFSDVAGDRMRAVAATATVNASGPNGMTPDKDGSVLMAQMGARRIARVDSALRVTGVVDRYRGKRLNSPNDLVFAHDGALWFTDPPFGLFNGMNKDPAKELPYNAVWRYAGGTLTPVITDLALPNGIAFSPDGATLYVSDYAVNTIYAYPVAAGGTLGARRTVIAMPDGGEGGADGMKVDTRGNIWATGPGGIRIITPQGKVLGQIRLPEVAANLAFAGDGHTLYITASTSVYRLRTKVAGVLPRYAR
jgi:gluconolactonase